MRCLHRCLALGTVLLSVTAPAGEPAAPLESTKKELRKLETNQKERSQPDIASGLRADMPGIQTPGQEPTPYLEATARERQEKERTAPKSTGDNWLLNSVRRLEKSDKAGQSTDVPEKEDLTSKEDEKDVIETSDPQYLLKVYDNQKEQEQTKRREVKNPPEKLPDPLAPFLKNWMGNSPVRGQFFDALVLQKSAQPVSGASESFHRLEPMTENRLQSPGHGEDQTLAQPKPNPYLTGLGSVEMPTTANDRQPTGISPESVLPSPAAGLPLVPAQTPIPEIRTNDRKAPPSVLETDRKYFPQLKKF